ncbi:endonuclease domain-containing protein [Hanstruepera marina]|uniref:endonuclease domain-containing protein n=1 Tax=Hanstruepera marina TaxID=2873265 RepID=UPI001CA7789F|nr:endonuclease domain-containing protein [Hanstruepera marina]
MSKQHIHNKIQLKSRRQELRKNLTPAEAFLWTHLKSRQLKWKRFTKQHSIGNYIVDFYCASERLIIELDGEVHNNPKAVSYDEIRTGYLNELGYQVLRFENKMVFNQLPSVLQDIIRHFKN